MVHFLINKNKLNIKPKKLFSQKDFLSKNSKNIHIGLGLG